MRVNRKSGFTLIELVIAVGLAAILSAVVMGNIGPGSRRHARDSQRQTDINNIAATLEMMRNDNGTYPQCTGGAATCDGSTGIVGLSGYMTIPTDPTTGRIYRYTPVDATNGVCSGADRCMRFTLCASSERDTTTNNDANCGNQPCGGGHCVFVVRNP